MLRPKTRSLAPFFLMLALFKLSAFVSPVNLQAEEAPKVAIPAKGRDCRFEIPGDQTIAREMIRLLLSGGMAPGVETNRCLKRERFLKLRTPKVSPSEEIPSDLLVRYEKGDTLKILEVKPLPPASPAEEQVRFELIKANGKKIQDSFSMLLYRSPRLQLMMGCAELLDPPKYRYLPASSSDCP